jgi:hypothetical protein
MADVYMNIEEVQTIADRYERIAGILHEVARVLELAMNTLKATACIGLVGGLVLQRYLEVIKPIIEHAAEYCEQIHIDLEDTIERYIRGDEIGSGRFY